MGLCFSGPINLSPIDKCREEICLEDSVPFALLLDPKLPVIFSTTTQGQVGSKSSMYTGTNPSCKDVPERMGNKAYLKEWATRHIHALHAGGFLGVVGYLNLKACLPLSHLLPPL